MKPKITRRPNTCLSNPGHPWQAQGCSEQASQLLSRDVKLCTPGSNLICHITDMGYEAFKRQFDEQELLNLSRGNAADIFFYFHFVFQSTLIKAEKNNYNQ